MLVAAVVMVLVLGAGLGAGYAWTRNQYFVGAAADRVAIYQGLPENLPGIQLSSVYEIQPLQLSSLPQYYRDMIGAGIEVESLDAARQTVAQLTETAKRCAQTIPTRSPTPSPPVTPPPASPPASTPPPGGATPGTSTAPSPRPTVIGPTVSPPPLQPSTSASGPAQPSTPAGTPAAASPTPRPDC